MSDYYKQVEINKIPQLIECYTTTIRDKPFLAVHLVVKTATDSSIATW